MIKWIAWPALAVAGMRSALAAIVLLCVLREWRTHWSWWLGRGTLAGAASIFWRREQTVLVHREPARGLRFPIEAPCGEMRVERRLEGRDQLWSAPWFVAFAGHASLPCAHSRVGGLPHRYRAIASSLRSSP